MKTFKLTYAGRGRTPDRNLAEQELTLDQAARLTAELESSGGISAGFTDIHSAMLFLDSGILSEDGDYAVTATIELLAEAPSLEDARRLDFPRNLLVRAVARMTGSADQLLGMTDSDAFDIVDVCEVRIAGHS